MIITIKQNEQTATHTIDTSGCFYAYAIRDAFIMALQLEGYTTEFINDVLPGLSEKPILHGPETPDLDIKFNP